MTNRAGYAAIVGRPNVGKSTLLNRLLGMKLAITAHKPQTTRHTILGVHTEAGGQVAYVDTPGMHLRGDNAMNRYLNRAARSVLHDVDLVLFMVEALRWTEEDAAVLKSIKESGARVMLLINKVDRVKDRQALLPYIAEVSARHDFLEVFPLSARDGTNLEAVQTRVLAAMPEADNLFPDDQLTDRSERFLAAELIREQLTRRYSKEIPYSLTVEIERFVEEGGLYRIGAVVWVERKGQKGIIVGKGGEGLKRVASAARVEMEKLFGRKVFLEVWVKEKKGWSDDERALARLGYGE